MDKRDADAMLKLEVVRRENCDVDVVALSYRL